MSFDVNDIAIQNVGSNIKYLGVHLLVCNNMLTIDVEDRIRKFNNDRCFIEYYSDLNEVMTCELIVKKCLHVLLMELVVFELLIVTRTNCTLLIEKYTDIFLRCRYVPVSDSSSEA